MKITVSKEVLAKAAPIAKKRGISVEEYINGLAMTGLLRRAAVKRNYIATKEKEGGKRGKKGKKTKMRVKAKAKAKKPAKAAAKTKTRKPAKRDPAKPRVRAKKEKVTQATSSEPKTNSGSSDRVPIEPMPTADLLA